MTELAVEIRFLKRFALLLMAATAGIAVLDVILSTDSSKSSFSLTMSWLMIGVLGTHVAKVLTKMNERLAALEERASVSPPDSMGAAPILPADPTRTSR